MPYPDLTAQLFQHLLEPGRVATALKPHHHLAILAAPRIESTDIILLMVQFELMNLTVFGCQITKPLFASMKVNPNVYCRHGRLLLLTQTATASVTTLGRRRLLH